jgi:3-oxoacyl-[acyl-carrier protein] reductase
MPFELAGRVALVTGATRGIGRATALILASAGCDLALVGRDATALGQVAGEVDVLGRSALTLSRDISLPDAVTEIITATMQRFGHLDILVNNAAAPSAGHIDAIDDDEWQRTLATNLTAVYRFCRAAFEPMRARNWGRIINIASITAQTGGVTGSVAYSASKGGVLALTRTLARDGAPFGITANAIAPGQIDTDMGRWRDSKALEALIATIPMGRLGSPEEIGYAVLFLASNEAAYITGVTLDVNGGLLKR